MIKAGLISDDRDCVDSGQRSRRKEKVIYGVLISWTKQGAADLRSRWDIRTFSRLFVGLSWWNFFPGGQIGAYISMQNFIKFTEKEDKPWLFFVSFDLTFCEEIHEK